MRRSRAPSPGDTAMTSAEVMERALPATRIHRLFSGSWMVVSGREAEESSDQMLDDMLDDGRTDLQHETLNAQSADDDAVTTMGRLVGTHLVERAGLG